MAAVKRYYYRATGRESGEFPPRYRPTSRTFHPILAIVSFMQLADLTHTFLSVTPKELNHPGEVVVTGFGRTDVFKRDLPLAMKQALLRIQPDTE